MIDVENAIQKSVHQKQAFIASLQDEYAVAQLISSFVNTEGGRIWIGIKNNGKIIGAFPPKVEEGLKIIVDHFCQPTIEYGTETHQIQHKYVVVVRLKPATIKPVFSLDTQNKWKAFLRSDTAIIQANKILLKVWKYQKKNLHISTDLNPDEMEILHCLIVSKTSTLSQLYATSTLKKSQVDEALTQLMLKQKVGYVLMNERICFEVREA